MEVKPGYKQTEVGVIPEEWEIKPLKRISPRQSVGLVIILPPILTKRAQCRFLSAQTFLRTPSTRRQQIASPRRVMSFSLHLAW